MTQSDPIVRLEHVNPLPEEPSAAPIGPLLERLDLSVRSLQDPVETGKSRRRPARRRSVALALAGTTTSAVAVIAVALTGALGGSSQNVLADVYRAITPGSGVLHMLIVTENTPAGNTSTTREELWTAQNPRRLRSIVTIDGESSEDAFTASPLKLLRWSASEPNVIQQSTPTGALTSEPTPVTWLREADANGELTVVGQTSLNGRPVYELDIHMISPRQTLNGQPLPDPTMLVDASTFVPVENVIESVVRTDGHPQLQVTRVHYLEYEELPDSEQNDALLELAAHPGATVRSEGH